MCRNQIHARERRLSSHLDIKTLIYPLLLIEDVIRDITERPSYEDQIVAEILGSVETYDLSDGGPNGPWTFGDLEVERVHNTIVFRNWETERYLGKLDLSELPGEDLAPETIDDILRGRLHRLHTRASANMTDDPAVVEADR